MVTTRLNRLKITALCNAGFLLCVCTVSVATTESLDAYITRIKQRPAGKIEPFPSLNIPAPHHYSADNSRNPFRKGIDGSDFRPDLHRPKQPLEAYALDALRMGGSFYKNTPEKQIIMQAIIITPDNKAVAVKIGDYMGENYGEITKITDSSVELMETVHTHAGWEKRPTALEAKSQDN